MPLLEVVRTNRTAPQVIVDLVDVGKRIKKTPVVVGNCTGFAVNRIFFPYTQAALLLVEHGVDPYQIDRAIYKFGMPMGPFRFIDFCASASCFFILDLHLTLIFFFRLIDLVGFGVAIATGGQFVQNFPDRTFKSMIIPLMQEDKRAGRVSPLKLRHLRLSFCWLYTSGRYFINDSVRYFYLSGSNYCSAHTQLTYEHHTFRHSRTHCQRFRKKSILYKNKTLMIGSLWNHILKYFMFLL